MIPAPDFTPTKGVDEIRNPFVITATVLALLAWPRRPRYPTAS